MFLVLPMIGLPGYDHTNPHEVFIVTDRLTDLDGDLLAVFTARVTARSKATAAAEA